MGNTMFYDEKYVKKHLKSIRDKAGARYTPELNVDLPISDVFQGISRTEKFYTTIRTKYGELYREFRYVTSKYKNHKLQKQYNLIKKDIEELLQILDNIKEFNTDFTRLWHLT